MLQIIVLEHCLPVFTKVISKYLKKIKIFLTHLIKPKKKENVRTQSTSGLWGIKEADKQTEELKDSQNIYINGNENVGNFFKKKKRDHTLSMGFFRAIDIFPEESNTRNMRGQPPDVKRESKMPSIGAPPGKNSNSIRLRNLLVEENKVNKTHSNHYGIGIETELVDENNITVNSKAIGSHEERKERQFYPTSVEVKNPGKDFSAMREEKCDLNSKIAHAIMVPPSLFISKNNSNSNIGKKDKENVDNQNFGKNNNNNQMALSSRPGPQCPSGQFLKARRHSHQDQHRLLQQKISAHNIPTFMEEEMEEEESESENTYVIDSNINLEVDQSNNNNNLNIAHNHNNNVNINNNNIPMGNEELADGNKGEVCELIIQPVDAYQNTFYCLNEKGGNIGRHSSNHIVVLEESVSRFHGQIVFKNNEFYLKDKGSTTGSYIKISGNMILEKGMIIEMGSNQFLIESLQCMTNSGTMVMLITEGIDQGSRYTVKLNCQSQSYTIGRKASSNLVFVNDNHLSNIHAKIFILNNQFVLEDLSSTNG